MNRIVTLGNTWTSIRLVTILMIADTAYSSIGTVLAAGDGARGGGG